MKPLRHCPWKCVIQIQQFFACTPFKHLSAYVLVCRKKRDVEGFRVTGHVACTLSASVLFQSAQLCTGNGLNLPCSFFYIFLLVVLVLAHQAVWEAGRKWAGCISLHWVHPGNRKKRGEWHQLHVVHNPWTRELISTQKTFHEHSNKDPSLLQ